MSTSKKGQWMRWLSAGLLLGLVALFVAVATVGPLRRFFIVAQIEMVDGQILEGTIRSETPEEIELELLLQAGQGWVRLPKERIHQVRYLPRYRSLFEAERRKQRREAEPLEMNLLQKLRRAIERWGGVSPL